MYIVPSLISLVSWLSFFLPAMVFFPRQIKSFDLSENYKHALFRPILTYYFIIIKTPTDMLTQELRDQLNVQRELNW